MFSLGSERLQIIAIWIVVVLTVVTGLVLLVNTTIFWISDDDTSDREGSTHSVSSDGVISDAEFDLSDPVVDGLIDQIAAASWRAQSRCWRAAAIHSTSKPTARQT